MLDSTFAFSRLEEAGLLKREEAIEDFAKSACAIMQERHADGPLIWYANPLAFTSSFLRLS